MITKSTIYTEKRNNETIKLISVPKSSTDNYEKALNIIKSDLQEYYGEIEKDIVIEYVGHKEFFGRVWEHSISKKPLVEIDGWTAYATGFDSLESALESVWENVKDYLDDIKDSEYVKMSEDAENFGFGYEFSFEIDKRKNMEPQ